MEDGMEKMEVCYWPRLLKEKAGDSKTKTTDKITFGIKYTNVKDYILEVEYETWWVIGYIAKIHLPEWRCNIPAAGWQISVVNFFGDCP